MGRNRWVTRTETLRRVKAEIEQCIDDLGKGLLPGSHFLYLPQHPASSLRGNQGLTLHSRLRRVDISDRLLDLAPPVGLSWHWDSTQPEVQLLGDHAA